MSHDISESTVLHFNYMQITIIKSKTIWVSRMVYN